MSRVAAVAAVGLIATLSAFAPIAAADDPPVTVPTPTVPAPDPAPPQARPTPAPKPQVRPAPPPAAPQRTPTPTPAAPPRTYTPPPAATRGTSRSAPVASHPKRAKKRRAVHKPKRIRPAVAPAPSRAAVVPRQPKKSVASPTLVAPEGDGWIRWLLLLLAATGLMLVSLTSLVGAARSPARPEAQALAFRRRQRLQIREVVAELVDRPIAFAAAAVAVPAPPRPAPPVPPAPEPVIAPDPVTPQVPVEVESDPGAIAARLEDEPETVDTEVMPEPTEEICEILVWRGYAKARFYARLELDETDEFAVAESPSFRFQGNGAPDNTEAARAAHRALVEKLRAKGWEQEDTTGPWYAARFHRPLERTLS